MFETNERKIIRSIEVHAHYCHGCFERVPQPSLWQTFCTCAKICICITSFRAPCPLQHGVYNVLFRTHVRTCMGLEPSVVHIVSLWRGLVKNTCVTWNSIYNFIISLQIWHIESETNATQHSNHKRDTCVLHCDTCSLIEDDFFLTKNESQN